MFSCMSQVVRHNSKGDHSFICQKVVDTESEYFIGLGLWQLMPLLTIFQLYRGGQFYWWSLCLVS